MIKQLTFIVFFIIIHIYHRDFGIQQILFLTLNTFYGSTGLLLGKNINNKFITPVSLIVNYLNDILAKTTLSYKEQATISIVNTYFFILKNISVIFGFSNSDLETIFLCLNFFVVIGYTLGIILDKNELNIMRSIFNYKLLTKKYHYRRLFVMRIVPHYISPIIYILIFFKNKKLNFNKKNNILFRYFLYFYIFTGILWYYYDKVRMNNILKNVLLKIHSLKSKEKLSFIEQCKYIQLNKNKIKFDDVDTDSLKEYKNYISYLYRRDYDSNFDNPQFFLNIQELFPLLTTGKDIFGKSDNSFKIVDDETIYTGSVGDFMNAVSPSSTVNELKKYINKNPGHFLRYYNNLSGQASYKIFRSPKDTGKIISLNLRLIGGITGGLIVNELIFKGVGLLYKFKKNKLSR